MARLKSPVKLSYGSQNFAIYKVSRQSVKKVCILVRNLTVEPRQLEFNHQPPSRQPLHVWGP